MPSVTHIHKAYASLSKLLGITTNCCQCPIASVTQTRLKKNKWKDDYTNTKPEPALRAASTLFKSNSWLLTGGLLLSGGSSLHPDTFCYCKLSFSSSNWLSPPNSSHCWLVLIGMHSHYVSSFHVLHVMTLASVSKPMFFYSRYQKIAFLLFVFTSFDLREIVDITKFELNL